MTDLDPVPHEPCSIQFFGAHPDDIEFFCGGTALLHAALGDAVTFTVVTDGAGGNSHDPSLSPQDCSQLRRREAETAADRAGATLRWIGLPDGSLADDEPSRLLVVDAIREAAPDIVVGPPEDDYNPDHVALWRLLHAATLRAALPSIITDHAPLGAHPRWMQHECFGGVGQQPWVYVDVSEVFERKLALLRDHGSQTAAAGVTWGHDWIEAAATLGRFRGIQSGTLYAEGYRPVLRFPNVVAEASLAAAPRLRDRFAVGALAGEGDAR